MAFNLWSHASEVAELFGVESPELRAAARVDARTQTQLRRGANALPKGLPRVPGAPHAARNANVGATHGSPTELKPFVDVQGQPSMKLAEAGEGVETRIRRNSRYAAYITDEDLTVMRALLDRIQGDAERLSQGPLKTRQLRKMGHPYGRGRVARNGRRRRGLGRIQPTRGVSNLSVVNRQGGAFTRAWGNGLKRDSRGVMLSLSNSSEVAPYLAFGTRRMKAHGPFTTAPVRSIPAIDREWRRIARVAWQRQMAEQNASGGS